MEFEQIIQNYLNTIKQMVDFPRFHLISYFDDAKARVDLTFEKKIMSLKDQKVIDQESKLRLELIELIEECQKKCLNNVLNDELINEANETISLIESNNTDVKKKQEIIRSIKIKLESHLLANDSLFVLVNYEHSFQKELIIVKDMFNPIEIEYLVKS